MDIPTFYSTCTHNILFCNTMPSARIQWLNVCNRVWLWNMLTGRNLLPQLLICHAGVTLFLTWLVPVVEPHSTGIKLLKHCHCSYQYDTLHAPWSSSILHPVLVNPIPHQSTPRLHSPSPSPHHPNLYSPLTSHPLHAPIHLYMHNCTHKYAWTQAWTPRMWA